MTYRQDLYKYCPRCGGLLEKKLLSSQEPVRLVCSICGYILYLDPKVAALAIIPLNGGLLLTRRAIQPGYGLWVAPGGFVDLGEPVKEAVVREVREEVLLEVKVSRLLNVYSYPGRTTIIIAYVTEVVGGTPGISEETLEVKIFPPDQIPWEELAFSSTRDALQDFLKARG
jgi:ADP-ribose pyrophosphatase YjhB (NUDIX family)